jgi:hypothetical protein
LRAGLLIPLAIIIQIVVSAALILFPRAVVIEDDYGMQDGLFVVNSRGTGVTLSITAPTQTAYLEFSGNFLTDCRAIPRARKLSN